MKRLAALLLAVAAATAQAETWRFALIGDAPYSAYERRELPRMIEAIADEHVEFIVHAGDFKHGQDACSDALFEDRRQLFDASPLPLVFVPGDNEWSDCSRVSAGGFDPRERLAKLRDLFFAGDDSLGRRRLALESQPGEYREHRRWRLGPVLFVSLNVPGGNNNYRPGGEPSDESRARMPQALAWLREGFALARREALPGIVVVMQANPGLGWFASGLAFGGYRELLETLREETLRFPGQVVLVHGDTHWQRVDRPLRDPASGRRLDNFTRVETFGYPYMGWVKGFIDTEAPGLFRFEARPWPRRTP